MTERRQNTWGFERARGSIWGFDRSRAFVKNIAQRIVEARHARRRIDLIPSNSSITRHNSPHTRSNDSPRPMRLDRLDLTRRQAALAGDRTSRRTDVHCSINPPCHPSAQSEIALLPIMPLGQEVMTDYSTDASVAQETSGRARAPIPRRTQKILTATRSNNLAAWPMGESRGPGADPTAARHGIGHRVYHAGRRDRRGELDRPAEHLRTYRAAARHAGLLQCDGYVERQGQVVHVMAKRMFDRSELIRGFEISARGISIEDAVIREAPPLAAGSTRRKRRWLQFDTSPRLIGLFRPTILTRPFLTCRSNLAGGIILTRYDRVRGILRADRRRHGCGGRSQSARKTARAPSCCSCSRTRRTILVTTHVHPDPDALASSLALCHAAQRATERRHRSHVDQGPDRRRDQRRVHATRER